MDNLDLKTFDQETRESIRDIYMDNVKKIHQTIAITKKYYLKELKNKTLKCPQCGKIIERINVVHAKRHDFANKTTGYWDKDNLVPMYSKECHENDDLETYVVNGKYIVFSKSKTGKDYRDYLKMKK